jgi:hypothetical protein
MEPSRAVRDYYLVHGPAQFPGNAIDGGSEGVFIVRVRDHQQDLRLSGTGIDSGGRRCENQKSGNRQKEPAHRARNLPAKHLFGLTQELAQADWPWPGRGEIQKDETEEHRCFASVRCGIPALREMSDEKCKRHLARENEGDRTRKQSQPDQEAAEEFQYAGKPDQRKGSLRVTRSPDATEEPKYSLGTVDSEGKARDQTQQRQGRSLKG